MTLEDIRIFFEWVMQGESTMQQRYEMFLNQRRVVEKQIAALSTICPSADIPLSMTLTFGSRCSQRSAQLAIVQSGCAAFRL